MPCGGAESFWLGYSMMPLLSIREFSVGRDENQFLTTLFKTLAPAFPIGPPQDSFLQGLCRLRRGLWNEIEASHWTPIDHILVSIYVMSLDILMNCWLIKTRMVTGNTNFVFRSRKSTPAITRLKDFKGKGQNCVSWGFWSTPCPGVNSSTYNSYILSWVWKHHHYLSCDWFNNLLWDKKVISTLETLCTF